MTKKRLKQIVAIYENRHRGMGDLQRAKHLASHLAFLLRLRDYQEDIHSMCFPDEIPERRELMIKYEKDGQPNVAIRWDIEILFDGTDWVNDVSIYHNGDKVR